MFPEVMLIVEYERVSEFQNVWKYGSHQRNWEECEDVTPTTPPLQTKIIKKCTKLQPCGWHCFLIHTHIPTTLFNPFILYVPEASGPW